MKINRVNPDVFSRSLPRAGPFHSPKVQSSPFAHSSGSFKQQSPQKQSLLSTPQKPNASLSLKTNGLHSAGPKSPKSSNNLSSSVQEPDLDSSPAHKKKKKKKRRHSEVEGDAEPVASAATVPPQADPVEPASEKKRKKKKKKRKKEHEDGEAATERECVLSHLDTANHEEDWCQGGMWSLTSHTNTEQSKQKPQLAARTPTQCESNQKEQGRDSIKLNKKKKKKKKMHLVEALQDTTSACSAPERWVKVEDSCFCFSIFLIYVA